MTQTPDRPGIDQLRNLADRAQRHGGLTADEAAKLRDGIDHLHREIDTLRAVCQSNKQAYVGAVKAAMEADQRAERAEVTLNAIRALADETDAYGYSSGWVLTVANIRDVLDQHGQTPAKEN